MKDNSFYSYLIVSVFAHLIVVLILVFTNSNWNIFSKPRNIQPSIRVDTIGLPELEKRKAKRKKVIKKEKTISLRKKKSSKKQKPKDKKAKVSDKTQNKDSEKKGNKLSQGIEGGLSESKQVETINIYLTLVIGKIKLNWNLPKYLSDGSYFTQLEVKIDDRGRVTYKNIVTSSGNAIFDSRVLKAIESSAPFPPPPSSVKKLISDGIVFGLSSKD